LSYLQTEKQGKVGLEVKNLTNEVPNLRCPKSTQQLNFLKMPNDFPLKVVPFKLLQFRDLWSATPHFISTAENQGCCDTGGDLIHRFFLDWNKI